MAYLLIVIVLLCIAGLVARVVLAGMRAADPSDDGSGLQQVTDRSVEPPAHPDAPLPGSATRRQAQGKP